MSRAEPNNPPPEDLLKPTLHDIADGDSVAIFDPDRISDEAAWILTERPYIVPAEDAR